MSNTQQDLFARLKAIIERPPRPANETDDDLFAQLRQCIITLRPDQLLHLASTAIAVYDAAVTRNMRAARTEQFRLERQIARHHALVADVRHRAAYYHNCSAEERRVAVVQAVLQRVKLDEDSVAMERKS